MASARKSRALWCCALALAVAYETPAPEAVAGQPSEDRPPRVEVNAQLDAPAATRGSMTGFIHSLSGRLPADARVVPLAPRLWRSDLFRAPLGRPRAMGAAYQLVLSDRWGYPHSDWQGRGAPWRDLGRWKRFVRRLARAYKGHRLQWDIWNEPDGRAFWRGGRRRFFRTFAAANRVLQRELGPTAEIGGPSLARFSRPWLRAFLDYCLAKRCRIDFLSWHENLDRRDRLESIQAHLLEARWTLLAEPRYAPLGMRSIHVNEYVGLEDRYLPGEAIGYLAQLERGGADLAARSCWSDAECGPSSLGGLLMPEEGLPRAVWWAHRWYAAGAETRVQSETSDPALVSLASSQQAGGAQVLLGRTRARAGGGLAAARELQPELVLHAGLADGSLAAARIERVPAAGKAVVRRPRSFGDDRVLVAHGGAVRLSLPAMQRHEAMRVTVTPIDSLFGAPLAPLPRLHEAAGAI